MDKRLIDERLRPQEERLRPCLKAARRLLSYRPRSEAEIRERLLKRGFEAQEVEDALNRLKNLGALDDAAFARSWQEDRNTFKPRSQKLLKIELKHKGVAAEVIDEVVAGADEKANACQLALRRARTMPVSDYQVFRRRLSAYLQRRGFDFSVINAAVKEAWQSRTQDAAGNSPEDQESVPENN